MPKSMINFDRFTFSGIGMLYTRLFKSVLAEDEKFTFISIGDFFKQPDNMSKINYLIGQGIENENLSGTFDFSELLDENDTEEVADQSSLEVASVGEELESEVKEDEADLNMSIDELNEMDVDLKDDIEEDAPSMKDM